jgi:hypothetical protein
MAGGCDEMAGSDLAILIGDCEETLKYFLALCSKDVFGYLVVL